MDRQQYHQRLFIAATLWNLTFAIVFLTLSRIDLNYFLMFGLTIPNTLLWFDSFMGLVFAFGLGFYFVSKDMRENHGLIQIACFEKSWVFLVAVIWFMLGTASIWVLLFASVDLIFSLLFIEDLLAIRKLS